MKTKKVMLAADNLIEVALNLTNDPLLCTRIGIYMNSERTNQIIDAVDAVEKLEGIEPDQKKKVVKKLNELDEQNVGVYVELYDRYTKLPKNEDYKN